MRVRKAFPENPRSLEQGSVNIAWRILYRVWGIVMRVRKAFPENPRSLEQGFSGTM